MYLKELEINGFKSFSGKIELNLTKGINAIVGPNGSGKSNIADAIRWVIGEQSVKTLRGNKMEDVIFAGSDKKKASGFAEVTLVLDNSDKGIDMDFNDISITRRMFRSGESEYYINKTQCRLKDITEMLMDTGVGKDGYSIIGQGRVDDILNNKAEGRRAIFEEAAGITKYKHRKLESEKKLEQTERNIIRLEDIINEIKTQLDPLNHQALVAKKYLKLMEELKTLEVNLIISNIEKSRDKLNDYIIELEQMTKLHDAKEEEINKQNQDKDNLKEAIRNLEFRIQTITEELYSLMNLKEKLEGEGRLILEKISFINITLDKLSKDGDNLRFEKTNTLIELDRNKNLLESLKSQTEELRETISSMEKEYKIRYSSIDDLENKIEAMKESHINLLNSSSDKKSNLNGLVSIKTSIENRSNQLNIDNALLLGQYEDKTALLDKVRSDINDIKSSMERIAESRRDLKDKKDSDTLMLKEIEDIYVETRSKKDNIISKLKFLEEMERDYGGYNKTIKSILSQHDNIKKKISGFRGVIGEIISVTGDHAVAIEIALGSTVQNIITDREEDAKAMIKFLKNNKLGRATFLPISSIKGKSFNQYEKQRMALPGVLGIAADMVKYEKEYKNIIYHLLGRIVVVNNMDTAIKLAKTSNYEYRIVTLDGELISPGGAITGGSLGSFASNILTRKSQISELKIDYSKITQELDRLGGKIEKYKDEIIVCEDDINHHTESLHSLEIEINNKTNKLNTLNNDIDLIKSKISISEKEFKELDTEKSKLSESITDLEQDLNKFKSEVNNIEIEIGVLQEKIKAQKGEGQNFYNDITSLKIKEAEFKNQAFSVEQNIKRDVSDLESLEFKIQENVDEIDNAKSDMISLDAKINENKRNIEEIVSNHEKKQKELEITEEDKKNKEATADNIELSLKSLQQDLTNIQNSLHKIEMQKVKNEMDIENLEFKLLDLYEMSYRKAIEVRVEGFNISKASKRCDELREEIRTLGTINVNAVEEYEKLSARYEFLRNQSDDLIKAKESLLDVINDITKYMKKQFIKEFNKININFNEVFAKLFGGGMAQVVLTDSEDVLGSDIEIVAKTPNKKLQNLLLMSGGERALTAIALLFAILKMKPAPFCVLDEIDSALDDANVDRYAAFLRDFSTQFIIITHRKGSMEVADCLYGVSMEDTGTSKLLSVKFEDKVS
ncbi:MAG: chromosome segregation protein SMC [Lutispora sp.]|nr:chromosome segregation protein SMC [Lutispora sp.]